MNAWPPRLHQPSWSICGLLALAFVAFGGAHIGRAQSATAPELVLQSGHTKDVARVAFSPDGRLLLSGSRDGTARIWDIERGFEMRVLSGHASEITAVAFSRDGRLAATGTDDNLVTLWAVATGQALFTRPTGNHNEGIFDLAFDPNGTRLISLHQDRTVTSWEIPGGRETIVLTRPAGTESGSLRFTGLTADGRWMMTDVLSPAALEVWDTTTRRRTAVSRVDGVGDMNGPAISPDGHWIVSTDEHMAITVWDVAGGKPVYVVPGDPNRKTNATFSFAFSPDGKVLAVGDADAKTIKLLDAATGRERRQLETPLANSLRFNEDGSRIAGVSGTDIAIYDIRSGGRLVQMLRGHTRATSSLAISSRGRFLATGSEDARTEIWDLGAGRIAQRLGVSRGNNRGASAVAFSPDEHWLAASYVDTSGGFLDDQVVVWNLASGREETRLIRFANGVTALAFSPDGKLLATGDYSGAVAIWETTTWRPLEAVKSDFDPPNRLTFGANGRWLASTRREGVDIWDVEKRKWTLHIPIAGVVIALASSPDGARLALSDSSRNVVDVVDPTNGRVLTSLATESTDITSLAFSPDGRTLAGSGIDNQTRLWDVQTGRVFRSLSGHAGAVHAVAFMPDGHWLFSAADDGSVRLWNATTGAPAAVLSATTAGTDWIVMTPDGLFDGSTEGAQKLILWRVGENLYPPDRFYASNFTPGLLRRVLDREALNAGVTLDAAKLPPIVRITSPASTDAAAAGHTVVTVDATDKGGGVGDVRLYHNSKLVGRRPGGRGPFQFDVDLVAGENILRALATSRDNVESNDDRVRLVTATTAVVMGRPTLRLLAIGVGEYQDARFNLSFARPDAAAIAGFFEKNSLFAAVDAIRLYDAMATKAAIQDALAQLVERAQPADVMMIYLAGHGVVLGEQFYFLPHEMRRANDDDAAIREYGIPASTFADSLMRAKALKQVLIIDACESEGALPLLAKAMMFRSRGVSAAQEKAIKTLARSSGVYLIAAASKQQEAYEIKDLGHGVLTYALLSGLGEKGEPKAQSAHDGIVTITSLVEYAQAQVPELTEKYRQEKQYVVTATTGTDFPLSAK